MVSANFPNFNLKYFHYFFDFLADWDLVFFLHVVSLVDWLIGVDFISFHKLLPCGEEISRASLT